ncbi:MAG: FecR family protein [Cyclobacteriaceae bacterium]
MKYEHFKFEDFVADPEFSAWVRTGSEESTSFWNQYLNTHPEQVQDIKLAKEFLQSMQFKMLDATESEYQEVLNHLLTARNSEIEIGSKTFSIGWPSISKRVIGKVMRYAATLALFSVVSYFIWQISNEQKPIPTATVSERIITKETGPGMKTQIKLPDGTLIWLNVESTVKFKMPFNDANRSVELIGEAYFEVESNPDRPFTVHTSKGQVKVFGTTFNVTSYPNEDQFTVALLEGNLSVHKNLLQGDEGLFLKPGQRSIMLRDFDQPLISEMRYARDMSWKDGILYFEKSRHTEIFTRLERWYDVTFKYSNTPSEKWEYSGYFDNMSLELVLQRLSFTENFEYSIVGKEVLIKFN